MIAVVLSPCTEMSFYQTRYYFPNKKNICSTETIFLSADPLINTVKYLKNSTIK